MNTKRIDTRSEAGVGGSEGQRRRRGHMVPEAGLPVRLWGAAGPAPQPREAAAF